MVWVITETWVDWQPLDVQVFFWKDWGFCLVFWATRAVKGTTEHIFGNWHTHDIPGELDASAGVVDIIGTFEDLDNTTFPLDFKDLTLALLTVT